MEEQESKHSSSHLASVFADILKAEDYVKPVVSTKLSRKKKLCEKHEAGSPSPDRKSRKRGNLDPSTSVSGVNRERTKREWDNLCRDKPDSVKNRELERGLVRIATRGVVQLFNAIREHQGRVGKAVSESRTTTVKIEKKVKSIVKKDTFFDLVSNGTKRRKDAMNDEVLSDDGVNTKKKVVSAPAKKLKIIKKEQEADEQEPVNTKWDVLRDDFLLSSAKDWDKDDDDG